MSKTFKNVAKIAVKNARETDNGTITFAEPLAITDDSRQWNNTRYDIDSLDITPYDGTVTADHGQKISDVIGKIVNLRKEGNKILIDGIRFAVNENPLAVLAKNLMKGGFVTGVSIETIGDDPDDTLTWKNHALCGLSVVAHPNNKNAYAVISNSVAEAKSYGLKVDAILNALEENEAQMKANLVKNETKLSKNLAFSAKKSYNNGMSELHNKTDQIINKLNGVITNASKSSNPIGNPWHDAQGRFTNSPLGAFHATTVHEASEYARGSKNYLYQSAYVTGGEYTITKDNTTVVLEGQVDENGHPTLPHDGFGESIILVNNNFTPEMAAIQATVQEREREIYRAHTDGKQEVDKMLRNAANSASTGNLKPEQISALNTLLAAKTRAGSKNAMNQQEAGDILAMNNTMKYVYQQYEKAGITGTNKKVTAKQADLKDYTAYNYSTGEKAGTPRYLKDGELYTQQYSGRDNEMEYKIAAQRTYKSDKGTSKERSNINVGRIYKGSKDYEPDLRLESGSFGSVRGIKAGVYNVSSEQFMAAQRAVFEDYQKELSKWM